MSSDKNNKLVLETIVRKTKSFTKKSKTSSLRPLTIINICSCKSINVYLDIPKKQLNNGIARILDGKAICEALSLRKT